MNRLEAGLPRTESMLRGMFQFRLAFSLNRREDKFINLPILKYDFLRELFKFNF